MGGVGVERALARRDGMGGVNSQGRCAGDFLAESQAQGKGQAMRASDGQGKCGPELGLGCILFSITINVPLRVSRARTSIPPHILTIALARPLPPLWQTLMPGLSGINGPVRPVLNLPFWQRLAQNTPFAALAIPSLSLPSFPSLGEIWDGVLKAVPKKKTSYMKKRTRFMAGKGIQDITSLNKCSACGRPKRAHILCPYCVDGRSLRRDTAGACI